MNQDYLFVYGTLRKHTDRHDLLQLFCEYIDNGTVPGSLYQIGHYPGVIVSDNPSHRVIGEVYRIKNYRSLFAELDDYEECSASFPEPHEYVRRLQTVTLDSGSQVRAWIYLYNHPTTGLKLIPSGDFLNP